MLIGKYLTKYYKKLWPFFLVGFFALIAVDIVETEIPKYLRIVVDEVDTLTGNALWDILGRVLLLAGAILVGRIVWRLCIFYASRKIEAGLRQDMFEKAERLSLSFFRENPVGTVMSYFTNDIETIGEFFGWGTVMLIDAVFMTLIVVIRMIAVDPYMTLIAALPIALIAVWGALVERFMAIKWDQRQEAFSELYDFSQENFTGIRVIKAFVKENQQIHAFAKIARKNADVEYSFGKLSSIFDVIIEIIISSIIALILGFGGYFVFCTVTGQPIQLFGHEISFTIGRLSEFVTLFQLLVWPMIAMGQVISMRSRAKTSLRRISHFLDAEEDVMSPRNAVALHNVKGKIEFRDFSFTYPKEATPALKNISFCINPGETIGIVGKVGSGKTTLANVLLRLYNYQDGGVFIDDVDLMDADLDTLRDAISYAPQDNFLFSASIKENIAFSDASIDMTRVKEAAVFADIDTSIAVFREGYDTVSGERGVTLSGGQKQRVSLARAYHKGAPILLMDDTVSAVDLKTEETILENIKLNRAGMTTLVIASRVSTVRDFDKILVLEDGCAVGFGSHEELMETSPAYQKMVYLQRLEAEAKEGGN